MTGVSIFARPCWHTVNGQTVFCRAKKGLKGDKFVGNLYVKFEQANKKEIDHLISKGLDEDEAYRQSALTQQALDLLQRWEAGDTGGQGAVENHEQLGLRRI